MCDRCLRQLRAALVERQHVRVAVQLERARHSRLERVVPGARRQHDNARHDLCTDQRCGKAGTTVVEHPHEVARHDATRGSVIRMDAEHLPALDPCLLAVWPQIILAVQLGRWLIGHEVQGIAPGEGCAEPLRGLEPDRVARAVLIAERGDGLGEDLDLP